jgi:O-antigen/teichoic acid export membrane protein
MTLKRNLIANYLGQGWTALMGLAFVPLYIKYLGIEAYGLIGLFAVLTAWFSLLDIGMTPTLSREMARFTGGGHSNESIRDLLRSIEFISLGIALLIAGSVVLGSNWIANSWLKAESLSVDLVSQAFAIMGLVTALRFVEGVYRSAIIGLQRQVLFNLVNSAMATLRGLGAVGILVWVSPTIKAFFIWQGVISIVTLGILSITTYGSLPKGDRSGHFSIKALRGVWRFAGGMMCITFLSLLLMQADKILLSKLLSLSDYGYYTLAAAVAGSLYMLVGPITQAFYPVFCTLHARNDANALADNYHKGAQLVSVIAGSAAIVLILFSKTFLHLWTQDAELAIRVAPLLSLLMTGNLLNGLMWVPYQSQLAHGWTSLTVSVNIVSVLLIVPAILWVVPRFGPEGAAWVWISLNAGYILIAVQFMHRRILTKEKWRWYLKDLLVPITSAFVAVALIKILWPTPAKFLSQMVVIGSALVSALIVSGLFAKHTRLQIERILKSAF